MRQNKILKVFILLPLSLIYGIIIWVRNKLFDLKILSSHEFSIPIISVGNITVGGTGKTPTIEYLIGIMRKEFSVATLSRGYKRKTRGHVIASLNSKSFEIGDEPKQIKQKYPETQVVVNANRVQGIKKILKHDNVNTILLDDAFQHRQVSSGISIMLIDYNRPLRGDFMLPYGNLRESPAQMKRCSIILVTKCPYDMKPIERRIIEKDLNLFPYQSLYFTTIKYGTPIKYYNRNEVVDLKSVSILLVTGIANPNPLLRHIEQFTTNIFHLEFPDHYYFTEKDVALIEKRFDDISDSNKIILTTEKDAMRFSDNTDQHSFLKNNLFYIPIEVDFLYNEGEQFNNQILNYVRTNKKHSGIYSK